MSGFDEARRAAVMAELLRPLTGQPAELLSFEAVREGLHLRQRYANSEVTDLQAARHFRFFFRPRKRFGDRLRAWWRRLRLG